LIIETDEEGSIRLSPVSEEGSSVKSSTAAPELVEENGILVLQAGACLDINKLLEEDREERMNKLMEGIQCLSVACRKRDRSVKPSRAKGNLFFAVIRPEF
jgi:hypothetical protein